MPRTPMNAGRLKTPTPLTPGAAVRAGGRAIPKPCRKLTTYPDQPAATVAVPSAYSRIRSQPIIQATSSPSVA